MFCRAKIGVALFLAGTLTGWAAPLNPQENHPASPHDGLITPAVLRPADAKAVIGTSSRWWGLKAPQVVRRINAPAAVGVDGIALTKTADAAHRPILEKKEERVEANRLAPRDAQAGAPRSTPSVPDGAATTKK